MDLKIKNRIAIVTGAGNGIGRAIALRLAAEGAKIIVTDLRREDAQDVASEIIALGGESIAFQSDATKELDVDKMVRQSIEAYGIIDILVNNVGGGSGMAPVAKTIIENWDKTIEINLKSAFLCCRAVVQVMISRKRGRIINISSISGRSGEPLIGAYCAAKFGVVGLTQVLARELGRYTITVNAVCPGYIYTHGWERLARELQKDYASLTNKTLEEIFEARVKSVTPLNDLRRPRI